MRKQHFIIRYKLKIKKVNERTSGGGNPGHTNKNDFLYILLSRTNFTEGSNFKGNYTFQSFRGAGDAVSNISMIDPTFFQEVGESIC